MKTVSNMARAHWAEFHVLVTLADFADGMERLVPDTDFLTVSHGIKHICVGACCTP